MEYAFEYIKKNQKITSNRSDLDRLGICPIMPKTSLDTELRRLVLKPFYFLTENERHYVPSDSPQEQSKIAQLCVFEFKKIAPCPPNFTK